MAAGETTDADLVRTITGVSGTLRIRHEWVVRFAYGEVTMAGGDEDALRRLYERHAAWLAARLSRRCADRDAVADALQDTFVAAWKGAGKFRGDGEVPAWLWGIARRQAAIATAPSFGPCTRLRPRRFASSFIRRWAGGRTGRW